MKAVILRSKLKSVPTMWSKWSEIFPGSHRHNESTYLSGILLSITTSVVILLEWLINFKTKKSPTRKNPGSAGEKRNIMHWRPTLQGNSGCLSLNHADKRLDSTLPSKWEIFFACHFSWSRNVIFTIFQTRGLWCNEHLNQAVLTELRWASWLDLPLEWVLPRCLEPTLLWSKLTFIIIFKDSLVHIENMKECFGILVGWLLIYTGKVSRSALLTYLGLEGEGRRCVVQTTCWT